MPDHLTTDIVNQAPDVTPADVLDEDALLNELTGLSPFDYDRRRTSTAKLLGVRVGALDAEVAARQQRQFEVAATADPGAAAGAAPTIWPKAVKGQRLLAALSAYYARYVVLPGGAPDALALWTVHTYAVDAAQVTPRLAVISPQPRCGKTTLMALLGAATARPLPASNITAAAVYRVIEERRPTLLIDEADTFLRDNEDLRGVLNAGHYRPQAFVVRCVPEGDTWVTRDFSCWAPVAIALIGRLTTTLADRSITVKLRRKTKHEQVKRLRLDRLGAIAERLRQRCLRWTHDHLAQLRDSDPVMPDLLHDRAADNWRPLCAIAAVAGGDWPQRAAHAISALTPQDLDDEAFGVVLLEDFYGLFEDEHKDRLPSEDVVTALHTLEERPWSEYGRKEKPITDRQVARLLNPFDIKSKKIRVGTATPRGYERDDFLDAWARYLPLLSLTAAPPNSSGTVEHTSIDAGESPVGSGTPFNHQSGTVEHTKNDAGFSVSQVEHASNGATVPLQTPRITAPENACSTVADRAQDTVPHTRARTPASILVCSTVPEKIPPTPGVGERINIGDWVTPLSTDGVIIPDPVWPLPYVVSAIEQGPDGKPYVQFMESGKYWPLAQCERADPPPIVDSPPHVEPTEDSPRHVEEF